MKVLCLLFWEGRVDFFVLIADGCAAVCRFTPYSSTASGPLDVFEENSTVASRHALSQGKANVKRSFGNRRKGIL